MRNSIFYKIIIVLLVFGIVSGLTSCNNNAKKGPSAKTIFNPILPGFYPDPSICRVKNDYYLVNSSFSYFPGIPVFHSRDLRNWKQIGYVLDRPGQINLDGQGVSRGIFAPTIRYHKGTYYVITTLIDHGGTFFVTAKNPAGHWSNPIWLKKINGIDPSFFFDDNDSCYILNNGPPIGKPLYKGHRAIWIQRFDLKQNQLVGPRKMIINGGTDIKKKPVWIEGPHIYKRGKEYFLCAAQGGTAENHSEVVFKSKSVWGPWKPYAKNPILTQRTLPSNRPAPVFTCTGHADLVKTQSGKWWAVFLGCEPYKPFDKDYFNTGRETFMAPVSWRTGWPIIGEKDKPLKRIYTAPDLKEYAPKGYHPLSGDFTIRDNFNEKKLPLYWEQLRTPAQKWYKLQNGKLVLTCRDVPLTGKGNPSFLGRRQQHAYCSATVSMQFNPEKENDKAGLVAFYNENHFYGLLLTRKGKQTVIELVKVNKVLAQSAITSGEAKTPIKLKIIAKGRFYDFEFQLQNKNWETLAGNIDGTFLSTKVAGGFVGDFFGMYAFGNSGNKAVFNWFEYSGKYKNNK